MNIEEIKALPNKATIKNFQGRITTGSPPKDPTPQQQRFGEHVQSLVVEDAEGDSIEVRLMRTGQHLTSTCVGKTAVFEAGEDNNGKPKGLKVEKWSGKNGDMCILSVDSKDGARTYLTEGPAPASDPASDPASAAPATRAVRGAGEPVISDAMKMVMKLQWCWDQINWVDGDDIRQKLATTLWIEMNMKRIDIPLSSTVAPLPAQAIPETININGEEMVVEDEAERTCETCGTDLGHGPGPDCAKCTMLAMAEKIPEKGPDRAKDSEKTPSGIEWSEEVTPAFAELRTKLCEKYTRPAYMQGFHIIYEANGDDLDETVSQILTETKDFKQLLFDLAEAHQNIPF